MSMVVVGIGWQKIEMFIGIKMYVKSCNYLKWKFSTDGAICLEIG